MEGKGSPSAQPTETCCPHCAAPNPTFPSDFTDAHYCTQTCYYAHEQVTYRSDPRLSGTKMLSLSSAAHTKTKRVRQEEAEDRQWWIQMAKFVGVVFVFMVGISIKWR